MNQIIQYGPYSPQETERLTNWLQQQNISFDITRNDQDAKEALMNDGQNLVNLADLRTGIYLAQIFYINLKDVSEENKIKFEKNFTAQPETFSRQTTTDEVQDAAMVQAASIKNQYKKRTWATVLAALLIVQIAIALYHIVFKES